MKCSICGHEVILVPSAAERAKKYGGTPQDFIRLFPQHADCLIRMRSDQAIETMRKAASCSAGLTVR